MKEFVTKVGSPVGLHARPAALFAQSAKSSGCKVSLAKISEDGSESALVDGASICVQVEGDNELGAAEALQAIVESSDH
jgi:phosphotransferase system HPr (HPr) family protein